eukprot:gene17333-23928_t
MLFRSVLVVLYLGLTAARKFSPAELNKLTFEDFLAAFPSYPTQCKEYAMEGNYKQILCNDQQREIFYRGRQKRNNVALKSAINDISNHLEISPVELLPKTVDWRGAGIVTSVKDQGHCGSCWAFASTATIESHVAKASGLLFDLSVEQMAMCAPNPNHCGGTGGCGGSTAELAFDYVTNSAGMYQEYQYGYTSYNGTNFACALPTVGSPVATINGFVALPTNNYTALLNAIAKLGPIAVSVDASNWHAYDSGVFSGCNQVNPDINHVVVLVGYGEDAGQKYWLIRNSWSPIYGEAGYIKLARQDTEEEVCGMDITPTDGSMCEGQDDPVKACGTCGVLYDSSYPLNAVAF